MSIVVDSSVVAKRLVSETDSDKARSLLLSWTRGGLDLVAPEILTVVSSFQPPRLDIASVNSPLKTIGANATDFGETRAAYRDPTVSGTNDPGGRLIEFQLRFNF